MQLRDYQTEILARTRHAFTKHRRVLLSLPVGAGKTVCASEMIRQAATLGRRSLFIVHRRELLLQAQRKLTEFGCDPSIVWSVQRLIRQEDLPDADFVVVDEAHHAVAESYTRVLEAYPDEWILGLSATPCRLDGRGLSSAFDVLVTGATVRQLCANGTLIKPIVFAPSVPDLRGLHIRQGEYITAELEERTRPIIGDIVKHWQAAPRGRTVCFAVSIDHSKAIVDAFHAAGINAEHIDGKHTTKQRDAILERLAIGATQVVSNCMLLGEGWDLPTLDTAVLARPTASWALHVQQVGRIMRPAPGKECCVVLDHAGNHLQHGMVTDEIRFSLAGRDVASKPRQPQRCKECFALMENGPPCPECGWKPEVKRAEPETKDGTLTEFVDDPGRVWYRGKVLEASRRGNKLGWAKWKFRERYGDWPEFRDIDTLYVCRGFEPSEKSPHRCAKCIRPIHGHKPVHVPPQASSDRSQTQTSTSQSPPRIGHQGTNPSTSRFTI